MTTGSEAGADELPAVLRAAVRYRYVAAVVVFLVTGVLAGPDEGDLPFFDIARHVLFGGGGLHLYALHPEIQIGPLALLGVLVSNAALFGQLSVAVVLVAAVLLLLMLRSAELIALEAGAEPARARLCVTVGGLVLAASWAVAVPGWGHPDDLAALLAMTGSIRAARNGGAWRAGLLLAVGVDCKPWAVFAVGVVLVLPTARDRLRALAALAAGVTVCWAPFLVAAPQSVSALARFQIPASASSLPGLAGATEAPHWIRFAQLLAATVAVVLCVRLGRWEVALLAVAVARLALDGGAYPYYDVELTAGCLIADAGLVARDSSVLARYAPLTLLSYLGMHLVHQISVASEAVPARLGLYALLALVAWLPRRARRVEQPGGAAVEAPALVG